MRNSARLCAALAALVLAGAGCQQPPPTTPDINIYIVSDNNNNNGVPPNPAPSACPSPTAAFEAKVAIIGGDGTKTVSVGQRFTVTFTRLDVQGREVPGHPSDFVGWSVTGAVDDRGSPLIAEGSYTGPQNYNRDLSAKTRPGSFTVRATQGALTAELVGDVVE